MNIDRITANPHILGGKPIIRGTRLSVEFILDLFASGLSAAGILEDYSHITAADIHACLRYAAHAFKMRSILNLNRLLHEVYPNKDSHRREYFPSLLNTTTSY